MVKVEWGTSFHAGGEVGRSARAREALIFVSAISSLLIVAQEAMS